MLVNTWGCSHMIYYGITGEKQVGTKLLHAPNNRMHKIYAEKTQSMENSKAETHM